MIGLLTTSFVGYVMNSRVMSCFTLRISITISKEKNWRQGNHLDAGTQPHTASWAYVGYWRELARMKPARGKTVLISGATQMAFGDLEKEVVSIKLDLPEVKELRAIYDRVLRQQGFDSCDDEERDRVVEAARGLTVMEAQTAFALAGLNNDRKNSTKMLYR